MCRQVCRGGSRGCAQRLPAIRTQRRRQQRQPWRRRARFTLPFHFFEKRRLRRNFGSICKRERQGESDQRQCPESTATSELYRRSLARAARRRCCGSRLLHVRTAAAKRTPFMPRRWPLPSCMGFLMPFRWFLYDWLCAVWLVDLAILQAGTRQQAGERRARHHRSRPQAQAGGRGDVRGPTLLLRRVSVEVAVARRLGFVGTSTPVSSSGFSMISPAVTDTLSDWRACSASSGRACVPDARATRLRLANSFCAASAAQI